MQEVLSDPVAILKNQGGAPGDVGELERSVMLRGRQLWVKRCGLFENSGWQDGFVL